jgi:hypothetical protein
MESRSTIQRRDAPDTDPPQLIEPSISMIALVESVGVFRFLLFVSRSVGINLVELAGLIGSGYGHVYPSLRQPC